MTKQRDGNLRFTMAILEPIVKQMGHVKKKAMK